MCKAPTCTSSSGTSAADQDISYCKLPVKVLEVLLAIASAIATLPAEFVRELVKQELTTRPSESAPRARSASVKQCKMQVLHDIHDIATKYPQEFREVAQSLGLIDSDNEKHIHDFATKYPQEVREVAQSLGLIDSDNEKPHSEIPGLETEDSPATTLESVRAPARDRTGTSQRSGKSRRASAKPQTWHSSFGGGNYPRPRSNRSHWSDEVWWFLTCIADCHPETKPEEFYKLAMFWFPEHDFPKQKLKTSFSGRKYRTHGASRSYTRHEPLLAPTQKVYPHTNRSHWDDAVWEYLTSTVDRYPGMKPEEFYLRAASKFPDRKFNKEKLIKSFSNRKYRCKAQ